MVHSILSRPRLDDPTGRGLLTVTGLGLVILLDLASAANDFGLAAFLGRMIAGEAVTEAEAMALDLRAGIIGLGQALALLGTAILFLRWFHRAHGNLTGAQLRNVRYTPAWAVGGFFVPVLNFWRPYQVMREVHDGSQVLAAGPPYPDDWHQHEPPLIVIGWWILFLTASLFGRATLTAFTASTVGELLTATHLQIAASLADVPAAAMAVMLVRRISGLQRRGEAALADAGRRVGVGAESGEHPPG